MKATCRLLVAGMLAFLPTVSSASDWPKQFAGLDGVALSCKDHSDGGYGRELCESYLKEVEQTIAKAGVPVINQGFFRHDEDQPKKPEEFENPLNVKLFIRGTAGGTIAIQLRSRASVTYEAAVEKGVEGEGRSGELVVWERSVTGSGPSKQLRPAISQAMVSRSSSLLGAVSKHWPDR